LQNLLPDLAKPGRELAVERFRGENLWEPHRKPIGNPWFLQFEPWIFTIQFLFLEPK
jgi:hypothetical protein